MKGKKIDLIIDGDNANVFSYPSPLFLTFVNKKHYFVLFPEDNEFTSDTYGIIRIDESIQNIDPISISFENLSGNKEVEINPFVLDK